MSGAIVPMWLYESMVEREGKEAVDALFAQLGVTAVDSWTEDIDLAEVMEKVNRG